jgi:choline dehydrogenase-like flavoprotein
MRKHADVQYLLVGSGVAASSIAKRLLENDPNASILTLEAGSRIPAKDRRLWWDYVVNNRLPYDYTYDERGANPSTGNTYWEMSGSRVTAYGGTTLHWGGWALRMKPEDFHLYTNTGQGGDWLMTYDDLEEYYCQAEHHLSVGGDSNDVSNWRSQPYPLPPYPWLKADLEFIEAFQSAGIRPGRMPLARYRKCMTTGTCRYCPLGARFSAQYVNEDLEAGPHPNFRIQTEASVLKIELDGRNRVRGVTYLDRSESEEPGRGEIRHVDAETVIVCAGAFESPKLLLRSTGPGHEDGIGNGTDLVGKYLVSHSFLSVTGTATTNSDRLVSEFGFPTVMSRAYDDESHQSGGKIFMFRNQNLPGQRWDSLMHNGASREEMDRVAVGKRQTGLSAFYEETGRKGNFLKPIPGQTDQFGLPLMEIHFDRDRETLVNANLRLAEMARIFSHMSDYTVVQSQFEGAAGFHASGTCRMGRTPEDGVTDGDLKVHGMNNLYVCSNAVFPSVGAVNPTLTLTALAFRLADHLIETASAPGPRREEVEA